MNPSRGELSQPFAPATSFHGEHPDDRAEGLVWISESGCNDESGLVLPGSERRNVWTYVEGWPGWHPAIDGKEDQLRDADRFRESGDPLGSYVAALAPGNRHVRQGFRRWMDPWLEDQVARTTARDAGVAMG